MIEIIIGIFAVLAIFLALILVGLYFIGWFGLANKVKNFFNQFLSRSHDQQYRNVQRVAINTQCYICLQRIKCPVITSCNHGYCAGCILRYIESKRNEQIQCPACRKKICVLFRQFQPNNQQQRQLKDKIADYNFKHSEQPGIVRSITQLPSIIRNAPTLLSSDGIRFLLSNPRVKVILVMLIYTLSPIDILPEGLLGPFGLFDDAFVTMNIVREIAGLMISFNQEQSARNRARNQDRNQQRQRLRA